MRIARTRTLHAAAYDPNTGKRRLNSDAIGLMLLTLLALGVIRL